MIPLKSAVRARGTPAVGFMRLTSLLEEKIDALSLEIFNGLILHKALRYTL